MNKSTDCKLTKINSYNKLQSGINNSANRNKNKLTSNSNRYTYAILPGNNAPLLNKVMTKSVRAKYWENNTHIYIKNYNKEPGTFNADNTVRKTPKKFVAGNIYAANNAATRPPSPLAVNFKWTPCSIKSDFYKLSAANTHLLPNNQSQEALAGRRGMINHLEGHRELTRKDDLIINLKTQL